MEKGVLKCIYCSSQNIIKKGVRKNKQQILQKYQCKDCSKFFIPNQIKYTTYQTKIILNAISQYNLGHTQKEVSKLMNELARSSQIKFETLEFIKKEKQNQANQLVKLARNLANNNKQRHETIQNFMLINDSVTIACEVPV